ncbi:hypothetical protein RFI_17476 [Reticulomyxa filosa]|uniref:Uncharacterized protein n=1 Tax=Reticulomyxa filosa TaxID=46433 RepID=X6N1G0_RETFI|nr:hypothetical protein RFI_17476 [Reticulomyxa filosa]|eukprot:ETO19753.1 hypothetical protein RFI_17476 [Reticulomyxa filosa]
MHNVKKKKNNNNNNNNNKKKYLMVVVYFSCMYSSILFLSHCVPSHSTLHFFMKAILPSQMARNFSWHGFKLVCKKKKNRVGRRKHVFCKSIFLFFFYIGNNRGLPQNDNEVLLDTMHKKIICCLEIDALLAMSFFQWI